MTTKIMISLLICALAATAVNSVNGAQDGVIAAMQRRNTVMQYYRSYMAAKTANDFAVHSMDVANDFPVHTFGDAVDFPIQSFDAEDDRVQQCFDYHMPKSNDIFQTYQTEYKGCLTEAQSAKEAQAALNEEKRTDLTNRGNKVSEDLEKCTAITDTLEFLSCYEKASASNSESLYKVSQDSSEQVNAVKIKYEEIENTKTVCGNTCRRKYTSETAANDKALQSCIAGDSTPPSGEVTTPSEKPTEEPTDAPTEEPTDAPTDEPTEEPTEETEEPTDEPSVPTDEPETEPERSPEEDIYRLSKSAQARRNILKHIIH